LMSEKVCFSSFGHGDVFDVAPADIHGRWW
jgi:hypothetical protein